MFIDLKNTKYYNITIHETYNLLPEKANRSKGWGAKPQA